MVMGTGLLPVSMLIDNVVLKSILLIASIALNITAVVKNFKEKEKHEN